jgi:hypothetical protein
VLVEAPEKIPVPFSLKKSILKKHLLGDDDFEKK